MKAIVFRMRLLEPLLIGQAGAGEENSAIGLPFIPGSTLRGALAARWLADHPGVDLAADPTSRTWFLDDTVCYLNAYPEYLGARALPKPVSWMTEKGVSHDSSATIFDLAVGESPELKEPKPPAGLYCRVEQIEPEDAWLQIEHRAVLIAPSRYEQVHITLENVNRRGEGNQVFRYDALAPHQVFAGVITAPDDCDLTGLQRLLNAGDLMMGSAHLAGYGLVAVEAASIQEDWTEYEPRAVDAAGRLVVSLLSHTILRDGSGQVGWDGGNALRKALGLPNDSDLQRVFGRTELVGGYNRKWSLPLPQAWALAAGSVFVFNVKDADVNALQQAIERGIGERRADGFGRIAVNWQTTGRLEQEAAQMVTMTRPSLSAASRRQAGDMAQRHLRLTLDRELAKRVNADAGRIHTPPANSQLSAVRQATLTGLTQKSMKPLLSHLDNLKQAGASQLQSCQMGNQSLLDWLRDRATKLDVQAQLLSGAALPRFAGETVTLSQDLKVEYTARLIDGIMQVVARQNRKVKR